MVDATLSALWERTQDRATGLPSMIQDGSIGLGFRLTTRLPVSISARDIVAPNKKAKMEDNAKGCSAAKLIIIV